VLRQQLLLLLRACRRAQVEEILTHTPASREWVDERLLKSMPSYAPNQALVSRETLTPIYEHMYVCVCVCVCVCMCVCVCIYMPFSAYLVHMKTYIYTYIT
jgi:hypothetical protein